MTERTGKRAIVSGGSGHIGAAICFALAASGHEVLVQYRTGRERADAVVEGIRSGGGEARAVSFDLTDGEATRAMLGGLVESEPVQIVVHAAGYHDDAPLAGMTGEAWQGVLDVSLTGFFNLVQPLLLPMIRARWGRVIAISSISGILGNRGQANYAAAKAGLHGAVKSLSLEYASRGITGNVVAPGVISTPGTDAAFPAERIEQLVPARRAGRPEDVANLVRFLASDEAGYISGQVIAVSGGLG
jgi:3-oxoacyl-[acyl-carrier protein] reductase